MRTHRQFTSVLAGVLTALALAVPASADQGQRRGQGDRGPQAQRRGEARRPSEAPRPQSRPAPNVENRAVPRAVPRFDGRWSGRTPSIIVSRPLSPVYRPWYTFRPRSVFSFGLSIGSPVAFPSWYDPFAYDGYYYNGYRSPYPNGGYRRYYGGVTFDIRPYDADIYVDGEYVGRAEEFGPYDAPLTLGTGRHRIEIAARGCGPSAFDVTVLSGQVIPYRGTLSCR